MFRKLSMLIAAAAILAACSNEPIATPEPEPQNRNALSFTYQNYTPVPTTYAEIALDQEKMVRDIDIWMFSGGSVVKRLAEGAGSDYTETSNGTTTTVTMTQTFLDTYKGQVLTFYFVGNNSASTGGKHITSFSGSEAQFADLLTTPLADGAQPGKAENIMIAPSTGGLLMTAKSAPILLTLGKRDITISLKRRVARFDIVNPKPYQYRVTEIYVSDVKVQGAMFAAGSGMAPIATRSLDKIVGPLPGDYDGTRAACAFYLYPTELMDETIALEVEYIGASDGEKELFTLADDTHVSIEANKRYTLTLNAADLTFTVGVDDYEDVDL